MRLNDSLVAYAAYLTLCFLLSKFWFGFLSLESLFSV